MRLDIVREIWLHPLEGRRQHHFLAQRKQGEWTDYPMLPGFMPEGVLAGPTDDRDFYFAPLGFSLPERRNKTAAGFAVLFADIDDGRVVKIDGELPSFLWRTSPGNYQAAWLLSEALPDYETWADLNQRLTYFLDADKGGWMGSKVLRIPGSYNAKRSGEGVQVYGQVVSERGTLFSPVTIDKIAPAIDVYRKVPSDNVPEPWVPYEVDAAIAEMPLSVKSMLFESNVRDRSLHIIQCINRMLEWGFEPETIFQVIRTRPFNKFRNRPDRLWTEVLSAAVTAD